VRYTSFTVIARLIAWFFVGLLYAVGPLLLVIAIVASIPTVFFVRNGVVADGTVIDLERVYSSQFSKEVYKPVVRFATTDGRIRLMMAHSNVRLKLGEHTRVIYLKGYPETARIDTIAQLWMPQIILGVIGALFSTFSVRMLLRRRARRLDLVGS